MTSTQTLNAALQGFADAQFDGIIQISVGSAAYLSGQRVNDRVTGPMALLGMPVLSRIPSRSTLRCIRTIAQKQYLDEWVRPILAGRAGVEVSHGQEPIVPVAYVGRVGNQP